MALLERAVNFTGNGVSAGRIRFLWGSFACFFSTAACLEDRDFSVFPFVAGFRAAGFLPAGFRAAGFLLAGFRAAGFLLAGFFFPVERLATVEDFFDALDFLLAAVWDLPEDFLLVRFDVPDLLFLSFERGEDFFFILGC